jgi:DNA-binding transcriptional ArsR family regulator
LPVVGKAFSESATMETRTLRRYLRHGLLPQLAAFDAVMRLGSVTRASEALHMAQPTVSGHLRKLSDALGVPLFRCDGRRMHPTAPARTLHAGTIDVFAALHDLESALAPLRDPACKPALRPHFTHNSRPTNASGAPAPDPNPTTPKE